MMDLMVDMHEIGHDEPIHAFEVVDSVEPIDASVGTESRFMNSDRGLGYLDMLSEKPGTEVLDGGVVAIETIFNAIVPESGIDPEGLKDVLREFGYWNENGMSLENIHDFFEMFGLPSALLGSGAFEDICIYIEAGLPVIISADYGEILGIDLPDEDTTSGERADYTFVIKDLDLSDPDNPMLTLYALDGSAESGVTVPLSVVEDAWKDGGCDYLIPGLTEAEVLEIQSPGESSVESQRVRARYV